MANRTETEERIARAHTRMAHYGHQARQAIPSLSEDSLDPITLEDMATAHEQLAETLEKAAADEQATEKALGAWEGAATGARFLLKKIMGEP